MQRLQPGPARRWTLAGLLFGGGGSALSLATLWVPWAVDGPAAGAAADQNGWAWMDYGDWLLVATVGFAAVALAMLLAARPSRRMPRRLGLLALALLPAAAFGAVIVWWLTGLNGASEIGPLEHAQGAGARLAVIGLGLTAVGVVAAMRSRRWDPSIVAPA